MVKGSHLSNVIIRRLVAEHWVMQGLGPDEAEERADELLEEEDADPDLFAGFRRLVEDLEEAEFEIVSFA